MYLQKIFDKRRNKTYLSVARGYRDENGKTKHKTLQYFGAVEDLRSQYDDPIAHFKEVVRQMNEEEKLNKAPLTLTIDKNEKMSENTDNLKNFGYVALSKIYHELEIDKFIKVKFQTRNFSEYKINNIVKLLVFARCLFPDSKKSTFENKDIFFENTNFSLKEIYNALTYI